MSTPPALLPTLPLPDEGYVAVWIRDVGSIGVTGRDVLYQEVRVQERGLSHVNAFDSLVVHLSRVGSIRVPLESNMRGHLNIGDVRLVKAADVAWDYRDEEDHYGRHHPSRGLR